MSKNCFECVKCDVCVHFERNIKESGNILPIEDFKSAAVNN